jgi:hypothetical protein
MGTGSARRIRPFQLERTSQTTITQRGARWAAVRIGYEVDRETDHDQE